MRTKTRLTLWLGLVTLLVLVLGGIGLATIWTLRTEGRDVMKANYNSIAYAQRMLEAMDLDTAGALPRLVRGLEEQRANITEPGEARLTAELARHIDAFRAAPGDAATARALRKDLNGIIELNRSAIVRKAAESEGRAESAVVWISVAGALCFVIVFTLFLSLPERLAEPIRRLTEGIDRIAAGHYHERVELQGSDEFAHMAQRFNAMAAELEHWESSNVARILEEKTRAEAVLNSLKDASIGLDDQGRILFMNREALELLGLEEAEARGRPAAELARRNDLLRHILSERASAPFKAVVGGKENYFVSVAAPIEGADGTLGIVHTVRDITPHKELDTAKTNFIATVSHELKTPIASILMGADLLRDERVGPLNAEQGQLLQHIKDDGQRLLRITSELLKMTQVETGRVDVDVRPTDPREVLRYAVEATRAAAEQKRIAITTEVREPLPLVRADSEKAAWTLTNLIGNAVRYSPEGRPVALTVASVAGGVEFAVSDEGKGIDPRYADRIFDRYFRVPGTPTEGSGLGLAIGKELIEAMGGRIGVHSQVGRGSRFWFVLPAAS
ncbi:MAG: HAMP domain-containing protein [Bacteroidetes bacterium]|nr:HAMP domain-containing protein [Bacteroidota bacterium]